MKKHENGWLAVREAFDHRSRDASLAEKFVHAADVNATIVDLACGTGANIRYLQQFFASDRKWIGVDNDSQLLASAADCSDLSQIRFLTCDLFRELPSVAKHSEIAITASAFLDVVSRAWVDEFVILFCELPILIAMTAAGLPEFEPFDHADIAICDVLSKHQRSDRGFGPALGCDATDYLASKLSGDGREVTLAPSDWKLCYHDTPLIEMMIGGIARRVRSLATSIDVDDWESRRREQLRSRQLKLTIKHLDLLSLPQ